jgi:hypothetical protein
MEYTLKQLIELYHSDPDSSFRKLRYQVRVKQDRMLTRISEEYGNHQLQSIKARTLRTWHKTWSSGGKIAIAHALMARLRALFSFGYTMLEDRECQRLLVTLKEIRFQGLGPRFVQMTAEHVRAIRTTARDHFGWYSIALARALQFELLLSQRRDRRVGTSRRTRRIRRHVAGTEVASRPSLVEHRQKSDLTPRCRIQREAHRSRSKDSTDGDART